MKRLLDFKRRDKISYYRYYLPVMFTMSNSSPYLVNFLCKLIFLTSVWVWVVEADVLVISLDTNSTVNAFPSLPANFGKVLPFDGLIGCVVIANPQNACNTIDPPPKNSNCSDKWFVLIRRYDCNFVDKVRAAQNANYDAAIIYNVGSNLIGKYPYLGCIYHFL